MWIVAERLSECRHGAAIEQVAEHDRSIAP
jgi:hypothetical protein